MYLDELAAIALQTLPAMRDPSSGLFSHKVLPTASGFRNVGLSPFYSAISTIGLVADSSSKATDPLESMGRTLDALYKRVVSNAPSPSLAAACLWALSLAGDSRANALVPYVRGRQNASANSSMTLGLVLAGLAAAAERFPGVRNKSGEIADWASNELLLRFSDSAQLFEGQSLSLRPRRVLHLRLTSFASQVYSLHGLAEWVRVFGKRTPAELGRAAERLVELQGPLGQWWWIYDARTGAVLEGYPVYSVHQDAMAFMALAALQNIGVGDYTAPLRRGLHWLFEENELGARLIDDERRLISRCIQRTGSDPEGYSGISRGNHLRVVLSSFGLARRNGVNAERRRLEILPECRSYHLGWILYARSLIRFPDAPIARRSEQSSS